MSALKSGNWRGCREHTDEPASRMTPYRPVVNNLSASYREKDHFGRFRDVHLPIGSDHGGTRVIRKVAIA